MSEGEVPEEFKQGIRSIIRISISTFERLRDVKFPDMREIKNLDLYAEAIAQIYMDENLDVDLAQYMTMGIWSSSPLLAEAIGRHYYEKLRKKASETRPQKMSDLQEGE